MGRTIIQPIGPLYGEPINGTVFGRPNGSIYVPSDNTISLTTTGTHITNQTYGGKYRVKFCDSEGDTTTFNTVAVSQDIASNIRIVLASDNDLSTILAIQNYSAGAFNNQGSINIVTNYQLTEGETYYVAALLINNNTAVASSLIKEVIAV